MINISRKSKNEKKIGCDKAFKINKKLCAITYEWLETAYASHIRPSSAWLHSMFSVSLLLDCMFQPILIYWRKTNAGSVATSTDTWIVHQWVVDQESFIKSASHYVILEQDHNFGQLPKVILITNLLETF